MQIQVDMDIVVVDRDKKRYLGLLLAGDESEAMIDRYLGRGTLYVGYVSGLPVAVCVTTDEDDVTVEVRNLAVREDMRRRGLGRQMLGHVPRRRLFSVPARRRQHSGFTNRADSAILIASSVSLLKTIPVL